MRVILMAIALAMMASHASSRNILMIVVDDMRVDARAQTPNLDALAAQSTRYTDAYTVVPVCLGSRVTVLSGMHPIEHGFTSTGASQHDAFFAQGGVTSLPKAMKAAGYYTAAVGKVFHTNTAGQWDETGPYLPYTEQFNPYSSGPDGTYIDAAPLDPNAVHPDQVTVDWATNFLSAPLGPFFLAVGFYRPHLPWRLPESYYDLYPDVQAHIPPTDILDDEPPQARALAFAPSPQGVSQYDWIANARKATDYTRYYLAGITHTDAMIGQVLAALKASGHDANTDIVVWSDHGYHLGEHRHWRKSTLWQEAVKVPFLIRAAAIPPGDVTTPVSLLDIGPTILDLAGAPPEPQFDGVSLRNDASPVTIFMNEAVAVVADGQKKIDYDPNDPGPDDIAIYDLSEDPGETVNLAPAGC